VATALLNAPAFIIESLRRWRRSLRAEARPVRTAIFFGFLFLLTVAIIFRLQWLFLMAAMVACLPWASYVVSSRTLNSIRCRVHFAEARLHEGQTANIPIEVTNEGILPKGFVRIVLDLPQGLALVHAETPVLSLLAGESIVVEYRVRALKRGVYRLSSARIETTDVLGIYQFSRPIERFSGEIVVYPEVLHLRRAAILAGGTTFGDALAAVSRRVGEGVDFYGIREYRPGDGLRRIHWKATAKAGHFVVVEYEHATTGEIVCALDLTKGTDLGSGRQSLLEYAVRIAASIGRLVHQLRFEYQLVAVGSEDWSVYLPDDARSDDPLLEALARVTADSDMAFGEVLTGWLNKITRGAGLIVITGNLDEQLAHAITQALAAGHATVVYYLEPESFAPGAKQGDGAAGRLLRRLQAHGATTVTIRRGESLVRKLEEG